MDGLKPRRGIALAGVPEPVAIEIVEWEAKRLMPPRRSLTESPTLSSWYLPPPLPDRSVVLNPGRTGVEVGEPVEVGDMLRIGGDLRFMKARSMDNVAGYAMQRATQARQIIDVMIF